MGRVARWLELHAEATRLHEQLMPLLSASLEQSQASGHAGNTDDGNLLELLARWQQLVGEMDTANLGPQAQALREPIARLARMNQEIGEGARQVRDLIATELRRLKQSDQNLRMYKNISGQR